MTLNPFAWFRVFLPCRHETTYRERREVSGVPDVYHFVCESCGQAWPCVSRTTAQYREMRSAGRQIQAMAHRRAR